MGGWCGFRDPCDDPYARLGDGVRFVDDRQRRLPAGDIGRGEADIGSEDQVALHLRPQTEGLKRRLGIAPGRHMPRVADCQSFLPQTPRHSGPWRQRSDAAAGVMRDHDHPVGEQHTPRRLQFVDLAAPLQVVHPARIGADKQVGRRAEPDLPGEDATRRIGHTDCGAGWRAAPLFHQQGHRAVHRPFKAGGRKDYAVAGNPRLHGLGEAERNSEKGE